MITFHFQNNPEGWLIPVSMLPDWSLIKFVFGVERCADAYAANPRIQTWYRWVGGQPLPSGDYAEHCRAWLNNFIDGTFERESQHVDYVQEYNETFANSQAWDEKKQWVDLHVTMAKVWAEEYRPRFPHIRIILAETAVGNDIPIEVAKAAMEYDAVLGYHPYQVCRVGQVNEAAAMIKSSGYTIEHHAPRASFRGEPGELYIMEHNAVREPGLMAATSGVLNRPSFVSPHDWRWYSGRWAFMDDNFTAAGIRVDWAFGEMGPVLDASTNWSGWLDPMGGWKHKDCLNRDFDKYLQVQKYWLDNVMTTRAYREGRVLGGVLFTSGAPGSGPSWANFDFERPHMDYLAKFVKEYPYGVITPPDPPAAVDWQSDLWDESVKRQDIELNPDAALQAEIFKDGFVPVQDEFWHTGPDDVQRAAQAAEHLGTGARRVYYAVVPKWDDIRWFSQSGFEVLDIVEALPTHAIMEYSTRSLDDITAVIVHHTVSPPDRTAEQIAAYHVDKRNWPGIAYHYLIGADGTIEQVNHDNAISYHAAGANDYSIGVSLKGDFTNAPPPAIQQEAAQWLTNILKRNYNIQQVIGHKEVVGSQTACPGDTWPSRWVIR